MGTNFYRVPTSSEVMTRRAKLYEEIAKMDIFNTQNLENGFRYLEGETEWESSTPWDIFMRGMNIHLGKRSSGWKFCWNFHNDKYYSNKEELLTFIRSGRIIDEYGTLIDNEEFITMALEWGQPNGWDTQTYYKENPQLYYNSSYDDKIIDGLRVSPSTEFS
jgi:hypothetical protein